MNSIPLLTIAISASGRYLVSVPANDDIYAAIDAYEAAQGEILEGFRILKRVGLAPSAPVGSAVLWSGAAGVAYRV